MNNPYQPIPAKIIEIVPQAKNIKLFRFSFGSEIIKEGGFHFEPGQIIELSIFGFGEAPFAPCGDPAKRYLELCVRDTGKLTHQLHQMRVGDKVGIRGPYGKGWPISFPSSPQTRGGLRRGDDKKNSNTTSPNPSSTEEGRKMENLLIVVGGLGLVPLRTLILGKDKYLGKSAKIQIFYGAKTPDDFLFHNEYAAWRKKGVEINLTIDKQCAGWNECVGLVTTLFDRYRLIPDARAFLCGPPIMYKFVLEQLKTKHFQDHDIFLSLERRMHCGLGVCQHCAVGPFYTCKDGPVFRYDKIKNIEGAI